MPRSFAHLRGEELKSQRNKEKKRGLNALAAIRRHLYKPRDIQLNEEETNILIRLRSIWHEECQGYPSRTIINKHLATFGIEESQAWIDLRNARDLFGNAKIINKTADAVIAGEMAKDLYRKAYDKSDWKTASDALGKFIKARGIDRADVEIPDFSKLEIKQDIITIPESQIGQLARIIQNHPVMNISDMITDTEDIPYEEE